MISKTHNYICNQLPNILENWKENQTKRLIRNEELSIEQDNLSNRFNDTYFVQQLINLSRWSSLQMSEDDIIQRYLKRLLDRSLMSGNKTY